MQIKAVHTMVIVAALFTFWTGGAFACGKVESRDGKFVTVADEPNPHPVTFTTMDAAKKAAAKDKRMFILFFCTPEQARVAGGDERIFAEFRSTHHNLWPIWTVFDCPVMTRAMKSHDMAAYVKIVQGSDTEELFKQYGVTPGNLVFCAPNGDKIVSADAGSKAALLDVLKNSNDYLAKWQAVQAAKASGAIIK